MKRVTILAVMLLMTLVLVSANGLTITNHNPQVNKTVGENKVIQFELTNTESFPMYNVTFEENNIIDMNPIASMAPGSVYSVGAAIITDDNFNGNVRIKGVYQANVGQNFETHTIEVYENTGIVNSECFKSVVKGDTIQWRNMLTSSVGQIRMINADNQNLITVLDPTENYTETFSSPTTFRYYFERYGQRFTDVCELYVLDDVGFINNPQLDAELNLDVDVVHAPTTIDVMVLNNNYEMNFYENQEGLMSITNTGDSTAQNIFLSGAWFVDFSENNFDLGPGQTNTLSYTIRPQGITTAETNKTHTKSMTIEGNFPTVTKNFDIFVKYAFIDNNNNYSGGDWLQQGLDYCENRRPTQDSYIELSGKLVICPEEPKIIYRNINSSDAPVNVTMTQEQIRQQQLFLFKLADDQEQFRKEMFIFMNSTENSLNDTNSKSTKAAENVDDALEKIDNINSGLYGALAFLLLLMIVAMLGAFVLYVRQKRRLKYVKR